MTSGTRSGVHRSAALLLIAAAGAAIAGCSSNEAGQRPLVPTTAAQLFGSDPAYELDFYDRLDRLPVVSYDDAIHSVLLLGGQSAPSYPQRVALAKQRGLLEENFSRPPREAVTIGEVAVMVERILTERVDQSYGEATSRLATRGILPQSARASQGLTGSQMLAVLGATEDFMAAQPEELDQETPLAIEPIPAQQPADTEHDEPQPEEDAFAGFETEPSEVQVAPAQPPEEEPGQPPRRVTADVEPLPDMPDEASDPRPAAGSDRSSPAPAQPQPEAQIEPPPAPPAQPEPQPEAQPAEPIPPAQPAAKGGGTRWVPGTPLRQGRR